ncbi:hypothetical protein B5X24_HaOG208231 [Helicoverpa armigera]|uniref:Saposin B-type domain-containing protein n=1 Tax=Helicoverpa armigera TaxID=29058 RepID=A0A2W1BGA5_HELAM|nr:hypothetical protein B5X24_HaOG208231 [Helicoverpa armigera]
MTKTPLWFLFSFYLILKISHAQSINRDWRNIPPTLNSKLPTPGPKPTPTFDKTTPTFDRTAPTFDRTTPKCYPETAVAYFLPVPPTAPKVTVLNTNANDKIPNFKSTAKENLLNVIKEVPQSTSFPPRNEMSKRVSFPPPPPCTTGLPDLMDEIPSMVQDRFSRLAETEEKTPVCESCAALIKKLPIFNFDQELLDGFLSGIGI